MPHHDDNAHRQGIPHVYVIIISIMLLAAAATWIIPSGSYLRVETHGGTVIVPDSYRPTEPHPIGIMEALMSVYRGMLTAGNTVFFMFITFASISVVVSTGAFHALVSRMLELFKGRRQILMIPIFILLIGMASSTISVFEEMFPFIPLFVGVAVSMKYDALVGMSIVALGIGLGYSGAFLNPFTVGIAQDIAGLAPFSGARYRIFSHMVLVAVASAYVMVYAARVAHARYHSLLYGHMKRGADISGDGAFREFELTKRRIAVILLVLVGIGTIIWGVRTQGWYFDQLSVVYLLIAIASGAAMGWSPNRIAHRWAEGTTGITQVCIKIALTKGIILILEESGILDTVIHWLAQPMKQLPVWFAGESMLFLQTILNFFVPSGTGQAVISMPLMIPLADIAGLSRQTAVLAYQFGDGLSNILWLTGSMPVICKFARVPPRKWLAFFVPLFVILYFVQMLLIAGAVLIGY